VRELVFLLEEESARELLEEILHRIFPEQSKIHPRFIVFEGKQDLEKQLVRKLAFYNNPEARFLVLRDQDAHPDCRAVKAKLLGLARESGRKQTKVRIACRELEAYYLGDLAAVEKGLGVKGLAKRQREAKYRKPDTIVSPARELERITKTAYSKVLGSRAIAPHLSLDSPLSPSFGQLLAAIRQLGS
jgi:hypothetical protein